MPPDVDVEKEATIVSPHVAVTDPRTGATEPTMVGGRIGGRYVVLEEVGRGGMGRVMRAYDSKLQREVALKEVKRERLDAEYTRRLAAEARAMAMLSHPNVVAVYDVEAAATEQLVLVMEYVDGPTLDQWWTARTWREIVRSFAAAGRGLAAAHAAGLLHRDFKPSNVLVADDAVKVTDFGLAKLARDATRSISEGLDASGDASDPPSLAAEGLTAAGMVLGTPRYMAPEQHMGEALTPATDQYAFCVSLWQALCGAVPFSGSDILRHKMAGPPPWPGGDAPRRVVDAMRRGLAADPAARWPSMNALLDVLEESTGARRRRWMFAVAGVGALGLSIAASMSWTAAEIEPCARESAEAQLRDVWDDARRTAVKDAILVVDAPFAARVWERTATELDAYADAWSDMHVDACMATTVRAEQSPAVLDLRMACLDRAKVELGAATAMLALADTELVSRAHTVVGGLLPLSRCADVEALEADVEPPLPRDAEAVERAREHLAAARVEQLAARYSAAKLEIDRARGELSQVEYEPVLAELALVEGLVLAATGDYPRAEESLREALRIATALRQDRDALRATTGLLQLVGYKLQRFEEGLRFAELAQALAKDDLGAQATIENNLVGLRVMQGHLGEAETAARRALKLWQENGADDTAIAGARDNLGSVLIEQGRALEAEVEHREALALWERAVGPDHPSVAMTRNNLGNALRALGRIDEAEAELRRALEIKEATLGPEHPNVASSRGNLAAVLLQKGKLKEGEAELRRATEATEEAMGPDDIGVARLLINLAVSLDLQERREEAEAEYLRAQEIFEQAVDAHHPALTMLRGNLVRNRRAQRRYAEAEATARRTVDALESADADPRTRAEFHAELGLALHGQGKQDEAKAELDRAQALTKAAGGTDHRSVTELREALAD
jgi:tetratricopeptide (TPR) repeat protein/tRNA A-37 threonylcarbamoyl transferase component Bud32